MSDIQTQSKPASHDEKIGTHDESSIDNIDQPQEAFTFTEKEERQLVRKIDFLVVPILTLLYLLSFLDRSNIGNAKIDGLVTDLKIRDYSSVVMIYFVGYVLAEVPANLMLKITNPPLWLPTLTLAWGIVSVCMGLVHNEQGLYASRFFLGVAEAGLFPGTVFVFSRFYKRSERTARVAFFFGGAAASGAFGGVLAYGITKMKGIGGKEGWAWLFILEGLLTVVVSIPAYFLVPNYPNISKKFSTREKQIIEARLRTDSDALDEEKFEWSEVWRALTTLQVYGYCFLFHGFSFGLYTLSNFLPSIIQGLGYKSWQAQLLTVPPYFFAFFTTMAAAIGTQRTGKRAVFIITAAGVSIVGYIALLTSPTVGGKYAAIFLCAGGIYSGNAILLAWPSENLMGQTFRATALAMVISIGNLGAIIGTQLYRIPLGHNANKNYHTSIGITIAWMFIGISSATALWYGLNKANKRLIAEYKERDERAAKEDGINSATSSQVAFNSNGQWKKNFLYQT